MTEATEHLCHEYLHLTPIKLGSYGTELIRNVARITVQHQCKPCINHSKFH